MALLTIWLVWKLKKQYINLLMITAFRYPDVSRPAAFLPRSDFSIQMKFNAIQKTLVTLNQLNFTV